MKKIKIKLDAEIAGQIAAALHAAAGVAEGTTALDALDEIFTSALMDAAEEQMTAEEVEEIYGAG